MAGKDEHRGKGRKKKELNGKERVLMKNNNQIGEGIKNLNYKVYSFFPKT